MPDNPDYPPNPTPPTDADQPTQGGTGNTPETYDDDQKASPYDRLRIMLRNRRTAIENNNTERLRELNRRIERLLINHPNNEKLWDEAESSGFNITGDMRDRANEQTGGAGTQEPSGGGDGGSGDSSGGGGGQGPPPNLRGEAADNRLLGEKGKHYVIRRTPKGGYLAVYSFRIGNVTKEIAVQIPRDRLSRYGIKEGEGKVLSRAQLKKIENIGWADELAPHVRQGDGHMVKSLERYLRNQYGGNPMLANDEVMGVVIANSLFGWSAGEFDNQLRNTKWYQGTNEWQRTWDNTMSDKERKNVTQSVRQQVLNALESNYGFKYLEHIDGGVEKINTWIENIASGKWGTPDEGLAFWSENHFDKASEIEGTPAWIAKQKQQEADNAFLNRPENKSEALRQDMMARFGRPILGKEERDQWAADPVAGTRSEADWERFMRQQMKTLYPYFDENLTFTEQASPFKAMLEQTLGTPVDWDHKLLSDFSKLDDSGKPTGTAMSLYDYQLLVRDPFRNPDAYKQGTNLFNEGMDQLADFLRQTKGV